MTQLNRRTVYISLLCLMPFIVLCSWYLLATNSLQHLDNITSLAAYGIRTLSLTALFSMVTRLANPMVAVAIILFITLLLYLMSGQQRLSLWFLLANAIGSLGINPLVKNIIQRQRPEEALRLVTESTYSFPSGHAFASIMLYGGLILIIWQTCKSGAIRTGATLFLGLVILLIGCSRIYLGVHYLSDVIAGYSLGLSWLILSDQLFGPTTSIPLDK